MQQVRYAGYVERLRMRQPPQQQLVPFGERRVTGSTEDEENRLRDAARVIFGKRPLLHRTEPWLAADRRRWRIGGPPWPVGEYRP